MQDYQYRPKVHKNTMIGSLERSYKFISRYMACVTNHAIFSVF